MRAAHVILPESAQFVFVALLGHHAHALFLHKANQPGLRAGLAQRPLQGNPHCTAYFQAGVQFAVNALHHREFFHAGREFLVGQGEQARILEGNRSLAAEGRQQVLVIFGERTAVFLVDDLDDAQHAVFDFHRNRQDGARHEAGLPVGGGIPGGGRSHIVDDDRLTGENRLPHKAAARRQTLPHQVFGNRALGHFEHQFAGLLRPPGRACRASAFRIFTALFRMFWESVSISIVEVSMVGNHVQRCQLARRAARSPAASVP